MAEKNTKNRPAAPAKPKGPAGKPAERAFGPAKGGRGGPRPGGRDGLKRRPRRPGGFGSDLAEEFEQRIIEVARVTRVMAGGKRMRFRACVALGNKKGKIAVGLAKGADVTMAVAKAVNQAKKSIIEVSIVKDTIAHEISQKFGAAKIFLKPAGPGRGVIAGGAVRIILELAGIKNVIGKIFGTNNKINNAKATIAALGNLKKIEVKAKDKKAAAENKSSADASDPAKTADNHNRSV